MSSPKKPGAKASPIRRAAEKLLRLAEQPLAPSPAIVLALAGDEEDIAYDDDSLREWLEELKSESGQIAAIVPTLRDLPADEPHGGSEALL